MKRLMLAAPASGSGKTVLTCGLLAALTARGIGAEAFNCGPDYNDPMFHQKVLGVPSRNLDLFLQGERGVRKTLAKQSRPVALIEGAMGYYDGVNGTDQASAWHLATAAKLPVVLAVRPGGSSLTLAAQIQGLQKFRPDSRLRGLLLTLCKPSLHAHLKPILERETGLPVLGYLPPLPEAAIASRHLGLYTAAEVDDLQQKLSLLADAAADTLDWPRLLALCEGPAPAAQTRNQTPPQVKIAVAQDEAFCFAYAETLEALQSAGAEPVFFSPLQDVALPEGIGGLYLPGGYPELHAAALSANKTMLQSVKNAIESGLPTAAECGGFLYLGQTLEDSAGKSYPMAGVLPGQGVRVGRLVRFGYASLTAKADSMLFQKGESLPVHEFHHWDSTANGADFTAARSNGKTWDCGFANEHFYAGFPHLYWAGTPLPQRFAAAARRYHEEKL